MLFLVHNQIFGWFAVDEWCFQDPVRFYNYAALLAVKRFDAFWSEQRNRITSTKDELEGFLWKFKLRREKLIKFILKYWITAKSGAKSEALKIA